MKIEVSNGEIVDKLTILEIKKNKCIDQDKLFNIQNELSYLEDIVKLIKVPDNIIEELRVVNKKLWEIEDDLRILESKNIFDETFVELSRLVYKTNDHRFLIKSKINQITNSNFKEEKILPKYNCK
jgi:hypothetical protein